VPDGAAVANAIRGVLGKLMKDHPARWMALSSVATGGDMIFAETSLAFGLPWHVLLPMPAERFREDFSDDEWLRAETLMKRSSHVDVTSDNTDDSREHDYLDCGLETVNECDVLVALWDGQEARGIGGTAEIVAYARSLAKPLVLIHSATLAVTRENFAGFQTLDEKVSFLQSLVARGGAVNVKSQADVPDALLRLQSAADEAAIAGSPKLRVLATMVIVFHSVAAFIGAFKLAFQLKWPVLAWGEVGFVCAGLSAALIYRRSFRHLAWVRCRLVAEISRAAIATWGLPRPPSFLREIEIPGVQRLVSSLHVLHRDVARHRAESIEGFRDSYIRDRVEDQHAYYTRQKAKALPKLRRLRFAFFATAGLGVSLTLVDAILLTMGLSLGGDLVQSFGFDFMPVVLPAFAAACVSMISINDFQRRVARYEEMITLLGVVHTQLAAARTWTSLEREVNKCERLLLREVFEWHTIASTSDAN
jgi:ABC-type multidrug transport system fused ATPase/permease subunit